MLYGATAASLTLTVIAPTPALARPQNVGRSLCGHLVTVRRDERAANAIYAGTRKVTLRDLRKLGWMEHCQRDPMARRFVRTYNRRLDVSHKQRVYAANNPMVRVVASWYYDGGQTASGWHSYYGVATCGSQASVCYSFGTKIEFSYHGRTVIAVVDDHGPYANGAAFDLNENVRAALGFDGVGLVGYRVLR